MALKRDIHFQSFFMSQELFTKQQPFEVSFLTLISLKVLYYHIKAVLNETWNLKGLYTFVIILVTYIKSVQTFFGEDLYLNALIEEW